MSYHAEKTRELTPLEFILPRTISVQRTTPPGDESWPDVLLVQGRRVRFEQCSEYGGGTGDWFIDCGRIHRVLSEDVERVYDQLVVEYNRALDAGPCDTRQPVDLGGKPAEWWGQGIGTELQAVMAQCAAGGVDTPGTRAEAERWCAMLCECVCEGMRATTDVSAYRLAKHEALGHMVGPDGKRIGAVPRGTPLGRP